MAKGRWTVAKRVGLTRRSLLAAAPLAPLLSPRRAAADDHPIGHVEEIDGGVEADGVRGRRKLTLGADVWMGDELRSDDAGGCTLRFDDDTLFDIGANSALFIDSFVYGAGAAEFSLNVLAGAFRFVSGHVAELRPDQFAVATPVAVIGVRGTHVAGTVEGDILHAMLLERELAQKSAAVVRNQVGQTVLADHGALHRWDHGRADARRVAAFDREQQSRYLDRFAMGQRLRRFHSHADAIRAVAARIPPERHRAILERLRAARRAIRALPADRRPAALARLRETLRRRLREN